MSALLAHIKAAWSELDKKTDKSRLTKYAYDYLRSLEDEVAQARFQAESAYTTINDTDTSEIDPDGGGIDASVAYAMAFADVIATTVAETRVTYDFLLIGA